MITKEKEEWENEEKHFALLLTFSVFCAALIYVTNTVPVGAVSQS